MAELKAGLYELDLVWKGGVRRTFQAEVNPNDPKDLREVLLHAMKQFRNDKEPFLGNYVLRVRKVGKREILRNFTAVK